MVAIATRKTVVGVREESTEGSLLALNSASQLIAAQDDVELAPQMDTLENAELRSSLATAKPIMGAENPSFTMSHYLRHSGVEGQAPNYGTLLKAVFGSTETYGTEYDTDSSSTTSVLKLPGSEANNFHARHIVLIKDPVNGYRIRGLTAATGTDLTLGFDLPAAPSSGVNLGKCVLYYPSNDSHPSLSVWQYLGGGLVASAAGVKLESLDLTATAGELVNATYSGTGLKWFGNPIEITSSTRYIDWTDDDGTHAAAVTEGWYDSPVELAAALQEAMNAETDETVTVQYLNVSGKFKISATGTLLSLLWQSGSNTANTIGTKIGFSVGANDTGTAATTGYSSDNAYVTASPYTADFDDASPLAAKNHEVMFGDHEDYQCLNASEIGVSIANSRAVQGSICAESGRSGATITARTVTMTMTFILQQYAAEDFYRYKKGTQVQMQYSFGEKVGGNWVPGKCGAFWCPYAVISEIAIEDQDGLAVLNLTLTAYAPDDGSSECVLGFV